MRRGVFAGVGLFVLLLAQPNSIFAQKGEIYSGNGGLLPTPFADAAVFKETDIYGIRPRLRVTEHHKRERNVEFPNRIEFEFFNFKYGGGIEAKRRWGPVGFGFVLRERTSPSLSRPNNNWVEATGGVTFAWGQR